MQEAQAQVAVDAWVAGYNTDRPHQVLGPDFSLAPADLRRTATAAVRDIAGQGRQHLNFLGEMLHMGDTHPSRHPALEVGTCSRHVKLHAGA